MSARRLRLYHRLQLATHRVQKAADAEILGAGGVSTAQAAVLAVVQRAQSLSQRALAEQLGLSEAAVATMAARLIRLNLLVRSPNPDDARAWRLALSAKGAHVLKRIEPAFRSINAALEQALGDDLENFVQTLDRVARRFAP